MREYIAFTVTNATRLWSGRSTNQRRTTTAHRTCPGRDLRSVGGLFVGNDGAKRFQLAFQLFDAVQILGLLLAESLILIVVCLELAHILLQGILLVAQRQNKVPPNVAPAKATALVTSIAP